jgi:hypothetical protein
MGGDPKTAKDALLDPEGRLDLLLGRLGTRRGLSKKDAARRLEQQGTNEIRRRQGTYL